MRVRLVFFWVDFSFFPFSFGWNRIVIYGGCDIDGL
jgi:hypothetical protein